MPHVLRLIAVSPMPGWFEGAAKVRRHETVRAAVINVCQGTQKSEELDGKELHGAAWWRVRSGVEKVNFFCTPVNNNSQHSPSKHLQMWYCAIFKAGGVFT